MLFPFLLLYPYPSPKNEKHIHLSKRLPKPQRNFRVYIFLYSIKFWVDLRMPVCLPNFVVCLVNIVRLTKIKMWAKNLRKKLKMIQTDPKTHIQHLHVYATKTETSFAFDVFYSLLISCADRWYKKRNKSTPLT